MSHYLVGVIVKDLEDVDMILAPFDENLPVEYEIEMTKEEILKKREKDIELCKIILKRENNDALKAVYEEKMQELKESTDEKYYQNYIKYRETDEKGNVVIPFNPNGKWDWFVIGGRWSDEIVLKDGSAASYAQIKDIDFEKTDITYAIVDEEEWYAPGEVGWFGGSSETDKEYLEWENKYIEKIKEYDDDMFLIFIDCHI